MDQYLIFFVLSFLASGLTMFLALNAFMRRPAAGAATFGCLMVSVSIWTFSIGAGMITTTENANYAWAVLRMAGVFAVPVIWLVFALHFSQNAAWLKPFHIILLSGIPFVSLILMATNARHHLFLQDIIFVRQGVFLIDETWLLGPWFWVHLAYSYLLLLIGDVFIIRRAIHVAKIWRRQAAALLVGAIFPTFVNLAFTFHLIPSIKVNYDPFGFVLAGVILSLGLFQYRLFDLKPIARQILVDNMADAMLVLDERGRVVDLNPAAQVIFKLTPDQAIGKVFESFLPFSQKREVTEPVLTEFVQVRDGVRKVYDLSVSPVTHHRRLSGRLIVLRDITERKIMEDKLREKAMTDSLTNIPNRRYFHELCTKEQLRARRYNHPFAVIFIDLDDFKQVNDVHGHMVGDQVLMHVAQVCLHTIRITDMAARYGGEEFTILQPETNCEEACQVAERLRLAIASAPLVEKDMQITITASIGIRIFDPKIDPEVSLEQLLDQADQAMYASKKKGKNCVTVWQEEEARSGWTSI